jgi:hypothetical protein
VLSNSEIQSDLSGSTSVSGMYSRYDMNAVASPTVSDDLTGNHPLSFDGTPMAAGQFLFSSRLLTNASYASLLSVFPAFVVLEPVFFQVGVYPVLFAGQTSPYVNITMSTLAVTGSFTITPVSSGVTFSPASLVFSSGTFLFSFVFFLPALSYSCLFLFSVLCSFSHCAVSDHCGFDGWSDTD